MKIFVVLLTGHLCIAATEIGYKSKASSSYVAIKNGASVSKITGKGFEVYCKSTLAKPFKVCLWKWKQEESSDCVLVNDNSVNPNCPGEIKRVENDKCSMIIGSYDPFKHEGQWECALITEDQDGDLDAASNLTMSIVTLEQTQPIVQESNLSLNPSDVIDLKCKSDKKVFPAQNGCSIFNWKIDGNDANGQVLNETLSDCAVKDFLNKCFVESTLKYTAQAGDKKISCFAQQTDTFGDIITSNEDIVTLDIAKDGTGNLTKDTKLKITLGVLIPLIILLIILLILAFYCGWCCCKDRRQQQNQISQEIKSPLYDKPQLEVRDAPKFPRYQQEELVLFPQPSYVKWPIAPYEDKFSEPAHDELLVYRWEGFGRPYSDSGSLSSLASFGHVDNLDFNKDLLRLRSFSSEDDFSSSSTEAEYTLVTDSWV